MKYMVSGMKPVAVKKPFNFDAAYEALEQSFRKASDAYEALVTSGSAVEEFEACLRDGAAALESIKKYGVTPQNMSLINEGNQLDKALGLEALDMTAIESLSESTKKLLQDNYTKGLEALGSENLKSFVQAIKDFFKKILEWLKERFFGLSRLTKILENTKIEGELDGEKKVTAIACDDIKAILDDQAEFSDSVHTIAEAGGKPASGFMQDLDELDKKGSEAGTLPEKKEDTVSGLGYDVAKAEQARVDFLATVKKVIPTLDADWKKIQAEFRKVESEDPSGEGFLEKIKTWRRGMIIANKFTGFTTKSLQIVGMSILAVSKAVKKAAPAEPAPAA